MNTPRLNPGAGYALLWTLYIAELREYGAPLQLTTGEGVQVGEVDPWCWCCEEPLPPCSCWPTNWPTLREGPQDYPESSCYNINPACPHHGDDARHVCNVAALGRSKHMEGTGWRCPPCGATWVLTRVQGAEQPVRLYPTMQWTRNAPKDT